MSMSDPIADMLIRIRNANSGEQEIMNESLEIIVPKKLGITVDSLDSLFRGVGSIP